MEATCMSMCGIGERCFLATWTLNPLLSESSKRPNISPFYDRYLPTMYGSIHWPLTAAVSRIRLSATQHVCLNIPEATGTSHTPNKTPPSPATHIPSFLLPALAPALPVLINGSPPTPGAQAGTWDSCPSVAGSLKQPQMLSLPAKIHSTNRSQSSIWKM